MCFLDPSPFVWKGGWVGLVYLLSHMPSPWEAQVVQTLPCILFCFYQKSPDKWKSDGRYSFTLKWSHSLMVPRLNPKGGDTLIWNGIWKIWPFSRALLSHISCLLTLMWCLVGLRNKSELSGLILNWFKHGHNLFMEFWCLLLHFILAHSFYQILNGADNSIKRV